MEDNTKIICKNKEIEEHFSWEKVFSSSEYINGSADTGIWNIDGLCSFSAFQKVIHCHPAPNQKILCALEKIVAEYYACEVGICLEDGCYIVSIGDDAQEKFPPLRTVYFGRYPQNGDKPEMMEWMILNENEEELLLLCKYSIASKGYVFDFSYDDHEYRKNLWEFSDLREWLNGDFYEKAFDKTERGLILTTEIKTMPNDMEPLDTIENKVFLLSKEQVEEYLPTPELRAGMRTVNAANDPNVLQSDRKKLEDIPWWILPHIERGAYGTSIGKDKNKRFTYMAYLQMVCGQGIHYHGRNVYHKDWAVRPAIRISKKTDTTGMKLMCGGKEVTAEQVHRAIGEYEQKIRSAEYQKEPEEFAKFMEASETNKTTGKAQNTRYEYRRLGSLDKVYKLDHVLYRAYMLNEENIWVQTVNGVYQDLAHGHIGSHLIEFNDIYPMEE